MFPIHQVQMRKGQNHQELQGNILLWVHWLISSQEVIAKVLVKRSIITLLWRVLYSHNPSNLDHKYMQIQDLQNLANLRMSLTKRIHPTHPADFPPQFNTKVSFTSRWVFVRKYQNTISDYNTIGWKIIYNVRLKIFLQ